MKFRSLFFAAAILLTFSFAAFSQSAVTNYSGQWEADLSKSELPEMLKSIEGISMTVKQDEKTILVETAIKGGRGGGFGGGMGSGRGNGTGSGAPPMGGGQMPRRQPQAMTYSLDGKETTSESGGGQFAGTSTLKAILSSEDLKLSSVRKGNSPMGEFTITTKETWTLSDGGKVLTVLQDRETPIGNLSAKLVFLKKEPGESKVAEAPVPMSAPTPEAAPIAREIPKQINAGVVNGKATILPIPEYPAAARAVRAFGEVKVQVIIGTDGSVISASAVSGHPLLRQSAVQAARNAKFTPTKLAGNPIEVSGVIVYNFAEPPKDE